MGPFTGFDPHHVKLNKHRYEINVTEHIVSSHCTRVLRGAQLYVFITTNLI
jgi:hypothetical protein